MKILHPAACRLHLLFLVVLTTLSLILRRRERKALRPKDLPVLLAIDLTLRGY
jgi:hypothetical protein